MELLAWSMPRMKLSRQKKDKTRTTEHKTHGINIYNKCVLKHVDLVLFWQQVHLVHLVSRIHRFHLYPCSLVHAME